MFVTYESARVPGEGIRLLWRVVHRSIHVPFFNVVFSDAEARGKQSLVLVERPEDLLALDTQEGVTIQEVDLITPGSINGSGRWMMGPLREIWRSDDGKQPSYVYVLMDGTQYASTTGKRTPIDLSRMKRIIGI